LTGNTAGAVHRYRTTPTTTPRIATSRPVTSTGANAALAGTSHTKDHCRDPDVMGRLLEYLLRHPVAAARTRYRPGPNTVTLYYREQRYHHGTVRRIGKREGLTAREFLARLASQIPEPGFQTVRDYGVYGNAYKGKALGESARTGLRHPLTRATPRWAEWVWRIHGIDGIDPRRCPSCGGWMAVVGLLLPEDGPLFRRWLEALEGQRPELPRSGDGSGLVSILNDVRLTLRQTLSHP
jgi:hypothetical protein